MEYKLHERIIHDWDSVEEFQSDIVDAYLLRKNTIYDLSRKLSCFDVETAAIYKKAYEFITDGTVLIVEERDINLIPEAYRFCTILRHHNSYHNKDENFLMYHNEVLHYIDSDNLSNSLSRLLEHDIEAVDEHTLELIIDNIDTISMNKSQYRAFENKIRNTRLTAPGIDVLAWCDVGGYDYWHDPENGLNYVALTISIHSKDVDEYDVENLVLDSITEFEEFVASGTKLVEYMEKGYI